MLYLARLIMGNGLLTSYYIGYTSDIQNSSISEKKRFVTRHLLDKGFNPLPSIADLGSSSIMAPENEVESK